MSHRTFGLLGMFVLLLLLTGSAQAQLRGLDDGGGFRNPIETLPVWDDDGIGFGKKIAGSWLSSGWFTVDVGCDGVIEFPFVPVTDAHTFGVSGSHVATNPANPNSGHGTWEKTGPRQITVRDVNFGVDATPNGTLLNRAIISMVVDFDRHFETATTTFEAKVYFPGDDPLDPDAIPYVCTSGQHDSFTKVNATE